MKRSRFIPKNSKAIEQKETGHIVYTYTNDQGSFLAIAYGGRRTKPDFHYRYKSEERRAESIKEYLAERKKRYDADQEYKAKRKLERQKAIANLKVGDIFHCGWGYEQTQCDFYQIISIKGQTAVISPIHAVTVPGSEGFDCDRRKASKDDFFGEQFKKRLNGDSFKITESQTAYKVENPENTDFYCSWYY
jgi:hypothetical protein